MSKRRFGLLALAAALALLPLAIGGGAGAAPGGAPVVSLSVDQAAFGAKQSVVLHVTIVNSNDRPVRVLRWYTPAGEVEEPLFTVMRDGAAVHYVGALYKRPAPAPEDYLTLAAGARLSYDVNLGAYYDLSQTGTYTIRYDVASPDLFAAKGARVVERMTSNEVAVKIEGRSSSGMSSSRAAFESVTGSTTFNKCSGTQQSQLLTARTEASNYASGALAYLQGNNRGARYTTWFGTYLAARYNTATSHFASIGSAMDTASVRFDCGCKKKYYAYVYPNQPYNIYVCSIFWQAPMTGTDSKAGTLIHEMSHFYVVASTDDYVYGQTNAKALAISNPDRAVDNADNHEYFAENNPYQP